MPKTLLLADDSVTIQKVVGISFANEDVRIVTVDNGDDAVKRAKEIRPDIVLADVVMPGKSGYDVCAALKGDPALAHIPVLLLTGTFETFDDDRAARVGADGHITKPFEAQALVELVNARLQNAAPAKSAAPAAAAPPAAKAAAAAEPESFDFLEPETAAPAPARASAARPVAAHADDAFAFEAEPLEAIDLDSEEDAAIDLGNEATAARTTLLLDEDDALSEAATAPPVRAATAPPVRGGTTPPLRGGTAPPVRGGTAPPVRGGTVPPVRGGTAPPVGGGTGPSAGHAAAPPPAPAPLDDPDERTRLVLQASEAPGAPAAADPFDGDPLGDLGSDAGDPFASPAARPEWDVASSELDDVFGPDTTAPAPAARPRTETPPAPAFTTPIFDDDAGAEFELTELVPASRPAPVAAPAPVATPAPAPAAAAAAPVAELSGAMRDQVHATIEKIAWEALGDVSERIVREAVARIEQVAWDVIPRLAETLIREEIRKLKGED
jgi:CheY-like chemotaxis protein